MDLAVDLVAFQDSPRARARFINQRSKKKVKEFLLKQRNYKRPDFNRMILDLNRLGWTHEKIADVLPVSGASTVSEWARGGIPNYENGDAFIMLWQMETGVDRYPREGEWATYRYKIGQLDMFEDWDELDSVIEQLDREIKGVKLFNISEASEYLAQHMVDSGTARKWKTYLHNNPVNYLKQHGFKISYTVVDGELKYKDSSLDVFIRLMGTGKNRNSVNQSLKRVDQRSIRNEKRLKRGWMR